MENEKKELHPEEMIKAAGGYQDGVCCFKEDTFPEQVLYMRKLALWHKEDGLPYQESGRILVEMNQKMSNSLMSNSDAYVTVKEAYGIADW